MILVTGGIQAVGVGTGGAVPFRIPVVQSQSAPKVIGLLVSHEEGKKHKITGKEEEGLCLNPVKIRKSVTGMY
jgi:hypothetical protein